MLFQELLANFLQWKFAPCDGDFVSDQFTIAGHKFDQFEWYTWYAQ